MSDAGEKSWDVAAALLPLLVGSAPIYFTGSDHLRLRVLNGGAGVTVQLSGRFISWDGVPVPFTDDLTPTTDRVASTRISQLGAGWLLNASVRVVAGAPRRGQTYVVVEIVRGFTGDVLPLGVVIQGYVSESSRLAWPGGLLADSIDGRGTLRSIAVADPAAGAEWSETVPTNARWVLYSVRATLTTDATVANRVPTVVIDDGANELARVASTAVQAASLVRPYSFGAFGVGIDQGASGVTVPAPFPLPLQGGWRVRSLTGAIVAGDDWSVPRLLVEEWVED